MTETVQGPSGRQKSQGQPSTSGASPKGVAQLGQVVTSAIGVMDARPVFAPGSTISGPAPCA